MEENKIYNSQNFVPNKKKMERPPVGTYVLLILYSLYILVPFYIIFISSLKSIQEAAFAEFTWWPTRGITWGAFTRVFESNEIGGQKRDFLVLAAYHDDPRYRYHDGYASYVRHYRLDRHPLAGHDPRYVRRYRHGILLASVYEGYSGRPYRRGKNRRNV